MASSAQLMGRVDVVPLVKVCNEGAEEAAAEGAGAGELVREVPTAVRDAAQSLANLARHSRSRIDLAHAGAARALARLCAACRDPVALRACASGLASLACFEGIAAQVADTGAISALSAMCADETAGAEAADVVVLRNTAGALANLALLPAARAEMVAAARRRRCSR